MSASLEWSGGVVTGEWTRPAADPHAALVLAHGAGKDMHDELLVGLARRLAGSGVAVLRFNFPYRQAGRKAPGPQHVSEDCYRSVAEAARSEAPRVFLGGKSYGGRMASHVVADGLPVDGLVFLGYPLHPPGKPERIRDAHLGDVACPMLFVQGTRDSFAKPELLSATLDRLPGARLVAVEGGDHSLKIRRTRYDDVIDDVARAAREFVGEFVGA